MHGIQAWSRLSHIFAFQEWRAFHPEEQVSGCNRVAVVIRPPTASDEPNASMNLATILDWTRHMLVNAGNV